MQLGRKMKRIVTAPPVLQSAFTQIAENSPKSRLHSE